MGKVSPKEKEPMALKQKRSRKARNRQSRTSSPAQHRFSRVTTRSCTDIGKKRILVLDSENVKDELLIQAKVVAVDHTPRVLSPERPDIKPMVGLLDGVKQQNFPGTPKTPRAYEFSSESRLESLPMDLLVFCIMSFFSYPLLIQGAACYIFFNDNAPPMCLGGFKQGNFTNKTLMNNNQALSEALILGSC